MEAMCGKFNHWKSYTESVIQGRPLGSLDKVLYRIRARKSSYVCVRKTYGGPNQWCSCMRYYIELGPVKALIYVTSEWYGHFLRDLPLEEKLRCVFYPQMICKNDVY